MSDEPQHEPAGGSADAKKALRSPAFFVLVAIALIGVWFIYAFIAGPARPSKYTNVNYDGVAEVLDIGETPTKCFVYIKREDGRETKQSIRKDDCGKFRAGDRINMENGQYVGTVPESYSGR